MAAAGADELMLADTIGVAVPAQVRRLMPDVLRSARRWPVGLHLHNTRNTGYVNALAGLEHGATLLDASIGGLGGCPFAPRATGNIATEDLVYMLEGEGIESGVSVAALIEVSEWLGSVLGRELPGLLYKAGGQPAAAVRGPALVATGVRSRGRWRSARPGLRAGCRWCRNCQATARPRSRTGSRASRCR